MDSSDMTLRGPAGDVAGTLRYIGNATVLIRWGDLTVLTDPNFIHRNEQLEIAPGVKATRLMDPAMEINDLPPIDLVVLSHFHADHFDQVAERDLRKDVPILTPPSAVEELEERGFTAARGLDTWASEEISAGESRIRITAVPGRHGPPVVDLLLPDVMGSILDLDSPYGGSRIYISGDTLVFDELHEIPRRYEGIDIGLLHLGGTKVGGIMVTMDGRQGLEALRIIDPERAIPIHFEDYDRFTSPLSEFLDEVRGAKLHDRVIVIPRGGTIAIGTPAAARLA